MLASITPLGERGRNSRLGVTFTAYLLGCIVGGAALGLALGVLGEALHAATIPGRVYIWVIAAGVGAVADLRIVPRLRLPTHKRQVPERWLYIYRGWVYGAGFGVQLGVAFATVVNSSLVYLMALAALLGGSLKAAVIIGSTFGCARAIALVPAARIQTPSQLMRMTDLLDRLDTQARRIAFGASMALAGGVAFIGIH